MYEIQKRITDMLLWMFNLMTHTIVVIIAPNTHCTHFEFLHNSIVYMLRWI